MSIVGRVHTRYLTPERNVSKLMACAIFSHLGLTMEREDEACRAELFKVDHGSWRSAPWTSSWVVPSKATMVTSFTRVGVARIVSMAAAIASSLGQP